MNPSGAYQGEMESFYKISEEEFDRLLAGKAPTAANGAQGQLSELIQSLQAEYLQAPQDAVQARHFAEIAKASQLITDKGEPATGPASKARGPNRTSGLPKLRRKAVLSGIFASLAAKIAAASMVALGATGGLAAADRLPQPAQDVVAAIAAPVVDLPDSAEEARKAAEDRRAESELILEEADEALEEAKQLANQGCVAAQEFGKRTAEAARQGLVDGSAISTEAKTLGEQCSAEHRQDGEQAEDAGTRQDAGRRPAGVPAGRPEGAGSVPASQGSVPPGAGAQSSTGIGTANGTPAQSYTPDQVPGGPSTAGQYRPEDVPAPGGFQSGRP